MNKSERHTRLYPHSGDDSAVTFQKQTQVGVHIFVGKGPQFSVTGPTNSGLPSSNGIHTVDGLFKDIKATQEQQSDQIFIGNRRPETSANARKAHFFLNFSKSWNTNFKCWGK